MFSWTGEFPQGIINKASTDFPRLKTQGVSIAQQYIVDGFAFTTNWVEDDIPNNTTRYAEFTAPAGYEMILDYRLVNASAEGTVYRVFPEGTYTVGAAKVDDADSFAKTRNLRQDSPFTQNPLIRHEISVAPDLTDQIIYVPVYGQAGSGSGNRAAGQLAPDNTFLLLDPGQKFLLSIFNGGAGNENVQVELNYAFVPQSAVSEVVASA